MQFHITESGALRVMVSDAELAEMGLSFTTLDDDPATYTALDSVLLTAKSQIGFSPTAPLCMEALPVDGGCLLLFTPDESRRKLRLRRAAPAGVWRFGTADALLAFSTALHPFADTLERRRTLCTASLYRQGDHYDLIVYAPSMLPRGTLALLSEFAEHIGNGTAAAVTEEHETPVCLREALVKLAKS